MDNATTAAFLYNLFLDLVVYLLVFFGLVVDLEVVVELHFTGVEVDIDFTEDYLEFFDWDVDAAVVGIVNVFDFILDFQDLRLITEGTEPTVVEAFAIRVIANDELLIKLFIMLVRNFLHFLHPKHSVCVTLYDPKSVSFTISSSSYFAGASHDIVVFTTRLLNVVVNFLFCHVLRLLSLVRCSAHVANAIEGPPSDGVRVVALHLGERLLENQGPNNIAVAHLGRKRLSIYEWDVVVDDNGLRHAKNEEIDGVATWLEQTLLKHGLHAVAG